MTTEFETWRPRRGELVLRHRSGLTARATRTAIDVGGVADPPAAHFRRVCINALAHLLAAHDRFVVHGAAIARKGQAILVLGGTGAGKSTVAACALRAGWEVLADDLVVLRDGQPAPLLGGVPRPLAVPPEVPTDDHLDARLVPGDVRGRRELPGHVVTRGSYPLSGSIAVGHGEHARGTLEPIEAHALLRMLLASWAPIESPDDLRRIFPIAASVARRPATRLSLGRDPATRVPDTVDLLDEARAQLARS